MQVTLAINNRNYHLQVPLNADLKSYVVQFLHQNSLSEKHCNTIQKLLKQTFSNAQLGEQQIQKSNFCSIKANVLNKIAQQINKKQQKEILPITKSCQSIYEEWKKKEKQKNIVKERQQNPKKIMSQKIDFYEKGLEFKKNHQKFCETQYKQLYPFQPNLKKKLNEQQKKNLYQRLHCKQKNKENVFYQKLLVTPLFEQLRKFDPYKQIIQQKNKLIDQALAQLLQQNILQNRVKILSKQKKPLRKTQIF